MKRNLLLRDGLFIGFLMAVMVSTAQQAPISRSNFNNNQKQVLPTGDIDTTTWLYYTIIIQNTGNSTAQNATIIDTLSDNLDPTSFQYLATSDTAPVTTEYSGGAIKFNLTDALLPPQSHDSLFSQSYVQFKIKPKAGLTPGTEILNTAQIYFSNTNAVITTNTTINTISATAAIIPVELPATALNVFPSPATTQLFINAAEFEPEWIAIYTVNGQMVSQQKYGRQINISALSAGVYFIEAGNETAVARSRFVKI